MPTVFDLILATAECLLMPMQGITTDVLDASTLIDANLEEPDGLFDGGTVWILDGLNAGRTGIIQLWDAPTKKFTLTQAMPNPILAGTRFAVMDARYTRENLIAALNNALSELGPFDQKNETLLIVDEKVRYTLPAGVRSIKRVQFATQAAEPFNWTAPHRWWREQGDELILSEYHLPSSLLTGLKIRLWYEAPHARVAADTDQVTGDVYAQRIAWQAAWAAARYIHNRGDSSSNQTKEILAEAKAQALAMQRQHLVRRMPKDQTWPDLP